MIRSILVCLMLMLAGCGWLPDRTLDYRKAEPKPDLQLPEGMTLEGEQQLFVVPSEDQRLRYDPEDEFEVPKPPQLAVVSRGEEPETLSDEPDPTRTSVVLARDGSGYPIIMMGTSFAWAWEYVGQALEQTVLQVDDRDRQSGVFFITVPDAIGLEEGEAHLKLSQTANGIQITVLRPEDGTLVEKGPGQDILQSLYDQL